MTTSNSIDSVVPSETTPIEASVSAGGAETPVVEATPPAISPPPPAVPEPVAKVETPAPEAKAPETPPVAPVRVVETKLRQLLAFRPGSTVGVVQIGGGWVAVIDTSVGEHVLLLPSVEATRLFGESFDSVSETLAASAARALSHAKANLLAT